MKSSTIDKLARQERTRREILNKSELIPTLPDLVVRIIELLNSPETEPEELEHHIRHDQVLVAKLLGIVNSPFYATNRKITTVADAVMVLGFRGVRSLVMATSTAPFLARDFSVYGHTERGLWSHALATGTAARTLAKECRLGLGAAEELFVAGLLHDVGKLLVLPYLNEAGVTTLGADEDACAIEADWIGLDHTEAGALVTAKWNLSEDLQAIIKAHHDDPTQTERSKEATIVCIANAIAKELGHGYEASFQREANIPESEIAKLGLDEAAWTSVREQVEHDVDAALTSMQDICA